jgi:sugar phosphate isomerase/epimerase
MPWPIGVFASIDAGLGVHLEVAKELGIPTIQLHAPSRQLRTPQAADEFVARLDDLGIELTCVFGGFEEESYADIPTVCATVGLVPPQWRAGRLQEMKQISDFARLLGCDCIALHLGFIPIGSSDTGLVDDVVDATRQLCDYAARNEQSLHLETGQETAEHLLEFLGLVDRSNLAVNFDPANMILYGTGDPIEALRLVGPHVRSVHCKDALWSDQPGVTWGREVPLGQGQVDMRLYLQTLHELGYSGPLTIEREIPQDPQRQKEEIGQAASLLAGLRQEILGT